MSKNIKTATTKDFEEVVATVAKFVEGPQVDCVADLAPRMKCREPGFGTCEKVYQKRNFEVPLMMYNEYRSANIGAS